MQLTVEELLRKIRALEIRSSRLSNRLFSGEYHSAFRGTGMQFKEVRSYYPGDDVRFIDWNVSARFGQPFSKVFEEERQRTVLLLTDRSRSMALGAHHRSLGERMIEMAAVLAFSAMSNQDHTGAILFGEKVEKYIPPAKGRKHLLYLLRQLIAHPPQPKATGLAEALQFALKTTRQQAIIFLLSDFQCELNLQNLLRPLSARHDCIAIHLYDESASQLPKAGIIPLQDAETGQIVWVDSYDDNTRKCWGQNWQKRQQKTESVLRQCGWSYLYCEAREDFVPVLQRFFNRRIQKT